MHHDLCIWLFPGKCCGSAVWGILTVFSWLHPSRRLRSGSKIRSVSPEIPAEKPYFFTETLADEYIGRAVELCIIEADALDRGYSLIDEAAWAWDSP